MRAGMMYCCLWYKSIAQKHLRGLCSARVVEHGGLLEGLGTDFDRKTEARLHLGCRSYLNLP